MTDLSILIRKMDRAYEKEYKEQFRNMTPEAIEFHMGLEKVRNVLEGFPKNHGIVDKGSARSKTDKKKLNTLIHLFLTN